MKVTVITVCRGRHRRFVG